MPLRLERVTPDREGPFKNFVQLYLHELSAYTQAHVNTEGAFDYPLHKDCHEGADYEAYFIVIKGRLAGFAVVRRCPDGSREVRDYFLLNSYRGLGLGREAAASLFSKWPGIWRVAALDASPGAKGFWRRTLRGILSKKFRTVQDKENGLILFEFDFHSAAAVQPLAADLS